jgi:HK97 family phage portal protein
MNRTRLDEILESNAKVQGIPIETKSSGFSPFVSQQLFGGGGYSSLSPTFAFWLYENSDTVGDAVDRIAWAFSQIQPALKDKKTGEFLNKPTDHSFLALMDSPGFYQNKEQLLFELMASFCVTGNCFPLASGNVKFEPGGLQTISANKANLISDSMDKLFQIYFNNNEDSRIYSRQMIPKRKTMVYQSDNKMSETIQIMIKQKKTGVQALSPLERIVHQAMTKHFGTVHNEGLLKNGSRPGGMWAPDNKEPMSQKNYEAFKNEVRGMSGSINAGKDIISPVPIKYNNFLLTSQDMDFIKLIEASKEDIYSQYQIPLPMVIKGNMTMGNYTEAQTAFLDLAVLPRARFLLKKLGEFLLPRYKDGDRYELTFDEKTLTALKGRMFAEAKIMREVGAFSDNEIRTTVGYESIGTEGDDIYKPANLVVTGDDDYTDDNRKSDND